MNLEVFHDLGMIFTKEFGANSVKSMRVSKEVFDRLCVELNLTVGVKQVTLYLNHGSLKVYV